MKNIFKIYGVVLIILLMTACSERDNTKIKVATNIWPGYERLYLAKIQGFFEEDLVEVKELSSATDVLRAYRNNLINAAALTLDETLPLLEAGYDGKIVLVFDISNGADVIMSKPQIKTFQDLKNKRVAVENTALGSYMILRALQENGMNESDLNIVPAVVNEHYDLYVEDKIDAAVTFEPVKTKLESLGAIELFSSKSLENEIIDILIVKNEIYNNKKLLNVLLDGFYKADIFARKNPKLSATIMAKREGVSSEEFLLSLDGLYLPNQIESRKLINDGIIEEALNSLQTVMLKKNLLHKNLDVKVLLP